MNVSDASEYPSDHSFFCSSQDDLPSYVSRITEAIYEDGSLTIQDLLMRLLEKLAKRAATYRQAMKSAASDDEEDENDDDDEDDVSPHPQTHVRYLLINGSAPRRREGRTLRRRAWRHGGTP